MEALYERLRFLRGEEAQDSFSAKIGLKQTTWGRYERGQGVPDAKTLQTICRVLHVESAWLLFGSGPMRSGEENAPQACTVEERKEYEAKATALAPSCQRCLELYEKLARANDRLYEAMRENSELKEVLGKAREEIATLKNAQSANDEDYPLSNAS